MNTGLDFFESLFAQGIISEYNHSNYIDTVDGKKSFHFDCSGFVYWCLGQMGYKRALVELRKFLRENDFIKINRFFCKDFAFIFEHRDDFKYWNFIDRPRPNCIMVVVFPDGNGHCMFVDKVLNSNDEKICLRVIDSTQYPHVKDTRTSDETGIGIGEIEIIRQDGDWLYNSGNPSLPTRQAEIYFVQPIK